jgi:hypothetical protein
VPQPGMGCGPSMVIVLALNRPLARARRSCIHTHTITQSHTLTLSHPLTHSLATRPTPVHTPSHAHSPTPPGGLHTCIYIRTLTRSHTPSNSLTVSQSHSLTLSHTRTLTDNRAYYTCATPLTHPPTDPHAVRRRAPGPHRPPRARSPRPG